MRPFKHNLGLKRLSLEKRNQISPLHLEADSVKDIYAFK